jgi:hypothetical protein
MIAEAAIGSRLRRARPSCEKGDIVNDFDPKGMLYQIFG